MHLQLGEDPEGLRVALEPVGEPEPVPGQPVEHPLAQVTERRMAEVVRVGRGLDDDVVEPAEVAQQVPVRIRSSRTAIARATAVTLIECVSRLWTTPPVAPAVITWVTSARRENDWANRIRSRSVRNSDSPPAYGVPASGCARCNRASMVCTLEASADGFSLVSTA